MLYKNNYQIFLFCKSLTFQLLNFISFNFKGQKGETGQPGLVGLSGEIGAKGSWV